jgi:hypothetical protein
MLFSESSRSLFASQLLVSGVRFPISLLFEFITPQGLTSRRAYSYRP